MLNPTESTHRFSKHILFILNISSNSIPGTREMKKNTSCRIINISKIMAKLTKICINNTENMYIWYVIFRGAFDGDICIP